MRCGRCRDVGDPQSADGGGRSLQPEELKNFDERFFIGTAAEVTPVSEVGEYRFKPGKASSTLINAYTEAVTPKQAAAE